jgi:ketosteroid isomerase-like protein
VGDNVIVASSRWYASFTDQTGKTTQYQGDVGQTFEKISDGWKLKLASWNVLPDVK